MLTTAGEVREHVWLSLIQARVALYPYPPFGHHPNFQGAATAAAKLLEVVLAEGLVKPGQAVLCYPDYVLKPLRKGLLEQGIQVLVPAKYGAKYRFLDSNKVSPEKASSIAGAETEGDLIEVLPDLHMTFVACVALSQAGGVLEKGYGFSLPEALEGLPCASIAHPLQVLESLPQISRMVTLFATPEKVSNLSAKAAVKV
jgi:5-formyltetrahydrofolate cyclo-ligase